MSWYDYVPSVPFQILNTIGGGNPFGEDVGGDISKALGIGSGDPGNKYRNALYAAGQQQGQYGQGLQGQYMQNQAGLNDTVAMLQGLAKGQNSVSAEQLRQGMQQGQAAQMSMAASAAPQDSAMAARTAMNNMGRLGYGLSSQQSLAGLQERQAALNALSQLQLGQSGQNMQGALGFAQNANNAYGTELGNPQSTWGQTWGGAVGGAAGAASKFLK